MKLFRGMICLLCCTSSPVFAVTLTNAWINPGSGNWEDAQNWSLGIRPGSGQSVALTNHGWKAIAIGANTSQNSPGSLNVASLVLGGYTDSFNLLLLNYAGFEVPLTVGSVYLGTNSGITVLDSALDVSTNSGAGDLSIFSTFNQGGNATVNCHTINLGNVTNSVQGFGTYNQTNGVVNADELSLAYGSIFNQFYGANSIGTLEMGAADSTGNFGEYNLSDGYLTVSDLQIFRGDFNQTGGSVNAGLGLGGNYTLSAGILTLPYGVDIPSLPCSQRNPCPRSIQVNATLLQTGGTNFCNGPMAVYNMLGAPGVGADVFGPGHYVLSNGVLCVSGTVNSGSPYFDGGGDFQQWGG